MPKPSRYEQHIKQLQNEGYLDKNKQYGVNDAAVVGDAGLQRDTYEKVKTKPYSELKFHRNRVVQDKGEGGPTVLGIDKALGERSNRPWQKYLVDAQDYNRDIDDGEPYYSDDELDELAEYVWNAYGYGTPEDDEFFLDHLKDHMGGESLDYHRQNAGYSGYKPSRWNRMTYSQKLKWLQNYGPKGADYRQEVSNAGRDYETLTGRKPSGERLTDRELWRERAARLANKNLNDPMLQRMKGFDDATIDLLMKLGFNRNGE